MKKGDVRSKVKRATERGLKAAAVRPELQVLEEPVESEMSLTFPQIMSTPRCQIATVLAAQAGGVSSRRGGTPLRAHNRD